MELGGFGEVSQKMDIRERGQAGSQTAGKIRKNRDG